MLVMSRRIDEQLAIILPDGRQVVVRVVAVDRGKVRLGVEADRDIPVMRSELLEKAEGRTS